MFKLSILQQQDSQAALINYPELLGRMDPGTIVGVVTASRTILSLLSTYFSDVKDAREDVKRFSKEVEDIHSILQKVEAIAKGPDAARQPGSGPALTAIEQSFSHIKELEEKLNPKTRQKIMKRVGLRALKWPFTKEQVTDYITKLERCKSSLNLALNADQT